VLGGGDKSSLSKYFLPPPSPREPLHVRMRAVEWNANWSFRFSQVAIPVRSFYVHLEILGTAPGMKIVPLVRFNPFIVLPLTPKRTFWRAICFLHRRQIDLCQGETNT
jgi:hypothetical protein